MNYLLLIIIILFVLGVGVVYCNNSPKAIPSIQYSAPIGVLQNGDSLPSHSIKPVPIKE